MLQYCLNQILKVKAKIFQVNYSFKGTNLFKKTFHENTEMVE
jgi:hypothetical protein